ncbi:hypothetical protein PGT21_017903 [Puccinia graminis f. sp. tritici]|uniref:Uncharacterized protein n=1 Tax=Puccinia graminis f. sp. tritici TaxID=56615 RepID=A0A5B0QN00_PUCGR|nr:hypothetical protein PGT21_017903 [Puccinia graminis f. sp. tritici]
MGIGCRFEAREENSFSRDRASQFLCNSLYPRGAADVCFSLEAVAPCHFFGRGQTSEADETCDAGATSLATCGVVSWDRTPMEERQDHGYLTRPPASYSSDFEKNLPKSMPPIGGLMASPVSSQYSDPGRLQLHVAVRLGCWYGLGALHQDGLGRTQVITTPACTQHVTVAYTWLATPPEGVQAAAITHPPVAQLIYCIAAWGRL